MVVYGVGLASQASHQPGGRTGDQDVSTQRLNRSSLISVSFVFKCCLCCFFYPFTWKMCFQQEFPKNLKGMASEVLRIIGNFHVLSFALFSFEIY